MVLDDYPLTHAGMSADSEMQKKYYDAGKVFVLQVESTKQCPQQCTYCYADSKATSPSGLPSAKVREVLESAANMEVRMIDWLGGDPLVRSDWFDLCTYAMDLDLTNNIWTSGLPLASASIAEKAVEVTQNGFISVHLDSLDPDLYLQMHGDCQDGERSLFKGTPPQKPNNIAQILQGIKNCLRAGKEPGAMVNCITLTKPLASRDARATISYMQEKFGIKTCLTLFNPVIPRGDNAAWEPTNAQIKEIFEFRDGVNYPDDPSCGSMDVSKFYCGTLLCVTFDGWLVPCSVIRTEEFGNVIDESLEVLFERGKPRLLYLDFRDSANLPGNCPNCDNNSTCFGCRSSAYYYNGDILAADPKCFQFTRKCKI